MYNNWNLNNTSEELNRFFELAEKSTNLRVEQ